MTTDLPLIPAAKPLIGPQERAAVDAVLASGMLAQGREGAAFEEEFAATLVGGRPCVAVNSGTSGLHLGLLASGVGPGDEVIVPSFTFAATANAVALTGATPVFADIDPVSFCLDPAAVEAAVTDRTRGVLGVHLYGHPFDVDGLQRVCQAHGLTLYEDAAQAHGATWKGQPVGGFGAFGVFSLYPTKNMTSGEGGMVSCANPELLRQVRLLRNQGMERQYHNEVVGLNNRMTDIHAAIGRVQLTKVGDWTTTRQANAAFLSQHLRQVVGVPQVHPDATHVWHQYTIRVPQDRDRFVEALRSQYGVGCGVYYPVPNHRLATFQVDADLPQTERAAAEVISLPVHPALSQGDLERIVEAVTRLAEAGR